MLFELLTGRQPFTGDTPLSVAYQHVNSGIPAPSALVPGLPAAVDQLVLAATSRDLARRPADAGEFVRAVRRVREGLSESSGLTGVMGVGVQGLAEAPWLDLDTPAATDGWWARSGTLPPVSVPDTGPVDAGLAGLGLAEPGPDGPASREDSHTLVVHREDGGRYAGGREFFLGRWLFSPRLLIVAVIIGLGAGLGFGGWWLTTGRYAQVPSVSEYSVTQATAVLTADGFKVKRGRVHSNTVAKGLVAGTRPAGRVSKGSTITILVSTGPFTSVVPNVQNDSLAAAQAALHRVHLNSAPQKVASNSPVGTVIGTKPPAGATWPQTKTVTILVAGGPPLPAFIGMTIDVARQWAAQHQVSLHEQSDTNSQQPAGIVTGQEPAAGAMFQPGQTVVVNVSAGPQLVPVPDPIGMSVEQATQMLQAAGFQVQVNRYGPFNKVWDFSPVGQAPRGSTITLDTGF
jgi:serine/threonine-protein kinase